MPVKHKQITDNRRGSTGGMTCAEIAEIFGVCRERIRQIEQRALGKIKKELTRQAELAGMTPYDFLFGDLEDAKTATPTNRERHGCQVSDG